MKIKQKKNSKRTAFTTISIVILLLLLAIVGWVFAQSSHSNSSEPNTARPATATPKGNSGTMTPSTVNSSTNESVKNPTSTTTPTNDLSVLITSKSQNTQTLQIRAEINKLLATGTCSITLTQGPSTVKPNPVAIQNLASTATCQGFDVPLSDLKPGDWNFVLQVVSGEKTASVTDKVTIN